MKIKIFLLISVIFASCLSEPKKINTTISDPKTEPKITDYKIDEPQFEYLRNYNGKALGDINIFEDERLLTRLQKLIGRKNLDIMISKWMLSSPYEVDENIFIAWGCEQHNCNATNFTIIININENILSVGMKIEDNIETFSENNIINDDLEYWSLDQ